MEPDLHRSIFRIHPGFPIDSFLIDDETQILHTDFPDTMDYFKGMQPGEERHEGFAYIPIVRRQYEEESYAYQS